MAEEKKTRKKYRWLTPAEIHGIFRADKEGFLFEYLEKSGISRQRADYHLQKIGRRRRQSFLRPSTIRSTVPIYNQLLQRIPSSSEHRDALSRRVGYNVNYYIKRMAENQMVNLSALLSLAEALGLELVLKERGDSDDAV